MNDPNQWAVGEMATFTYGFPNDPTSEIAARLNHRTGETVTVLSEDDPDGNRAAFPTFEERMDAGAPVTYRVRFPDGHEDSAFEDELSEVKR